jgi:hypothetical protein
VIRLRGEEGGKGVDLGPLRVIVDFPCLNTLWCEEQEYKL